MHSTSREEKRRSKRNREIADNVRAVRELVGLSQAAIAKALGLSRPVFVTLESGDRRLPVAELEEIARLLGCPFRVLLARPGDAPAIVHDPAVYRSRSPLCIAIDVAQELSKKEGN